MQIKALIFDLDGVIANTNHFHFLAWQKLSHSIGAELTARQYDLLKGLSRSDSLEKILLWNSIGLSEEQKTTLASRKNNWYGKLIQNFSPEDAIPGAISFVEKAKNSGFSIALGSSSKNAVAILKSLQIEHLFDIVVDGHQTNKGKPDPEVFRKCLQFFKLLPGEIVIFEDAPSGLEAATRLGSPTIGIGKEKDLTLADMVISSFDGYDPIPLINQLLLQIPDHRSRG